MESSVVLCLLGCCFILLPPGTGEVFSAIAHMEKLVAAEFELAQSLESYIIAEEARLDRIRAIGRLVSNVSEAANVNIGRYLGHPVNAYRLLRRFMSDWREIEDLVAQPATAEEFVSRLTHYKPAFPSDDDLSGAATALMRLQNTYRLAPSALVDGRIPGDQKEKMSAEDCYYLGTVAYKVEDYEHTRNWMDEALKRWDLEDSGDLNLVDVYDYLAFAEYKLGNLKRAVRLTREIIMLEPDHSRALDNMAYFEQKLSEESHKRGEDLSIDAVTAARRQQQQSHTEEKEVDYTSMDSKRLSWDEERRRYEKLCREPFPIADWRRRHFKCFYTTGGQNPLLILKPIAVEVVYFKPTVLLYRNILSDSELNYLKKLAAPKLNRATTYNLAEKRFMPADYRVSKSAWLGPEDDNTGIVQRIDNRIEALTGLNMNTAEQLQVVNYGIGGQYEPHYDHARDGEDAFSDSSTGNRIATLLFYLSDVEAGGATVFTIAGARVVPSKGDATFWYNLLPSGQGDFTTRHAGCPVLSGLKWVCNKWIHERGQEFRKQCKPDKNADWDIHVP